MNKDRYRFAECNNDLWLGALVLRVKACGGRGERRKEKECLFTYCLRGFVTIEAEIINLLVYGAENARFE